MDTEPLSESLTSADSPERRHRLQSAQIEEGARAGEFRRAQIEEGDCFCRQVIGWKWARSIFGTDVSQPRNDSAGQDFFPRILITSG